jgi:hypothetical protein
MAAFLKLPNGGGSVVINQDFAGEGLDPALLTVYLNAYTNGALPLDALMYALEKGRLPEDFQAEDEGARQVVSDRIGYLFAAVVGGLAFKYYGPPGVYVMILLYFLGALRAYERWKKLDKEDKR